MSAEKPRIPVIPTRLNEFGYDPFGFSPRYLAQWAQPAVWLYRNYHRVETHGVHNIPHDGGALLVANHAGGLWALDSVMCAVAVHDSHPAIFVETLEADH